MSEINLFKLEKNNAIKLQSETVVIERELQNIIEQNMNDFFGTTFLDSEYSIDGGRIDSLGLDENYSPVIFEYKRSSSENVINQGLFYMDWLVTHQDSFYLLVMNKLGKEIADKIDWSLPRLYCVASNFTKYDENAINQMSRNISLFRYKKFNSNLILLELLGSNINTKKLSSLNNTNNGKSSDLTFAEKYDRANKITRELYENIRLFILSLGDDVTENQLKLYVAFKKTKNIVCLEIHSVEILCYLRLNPKSYFLEDGFTKDMSSIGHWGTGDLEVRIKNSNDFENAKHLFEDAYNKN